MHFYSAPVENELKTSGLQHSKKKRKNSKYTQNLTNLKYGSIIKWKVQEYNFLLSN